MSKYRDLAQVLEVLPTTVRMTREAHRLSFRQAAEQIGFSHTALWRYEHGHDEPNAAQLRMILVWLDGAA